MENIQDDIPRMLLETLIAIGLIFFLSTFLRAIFGFGDALIAMPLLSLLIPLHMATPLYALIAITISLFILIKHRQHLLINHIIPLLVFSALGIPLGILFLTRIKEEIITVLLGLVIIIFSSYQLIKPQIHEKHSRILSVPFGFCAGILGGAYNVNGPPIVVYATLQQWDPRTFRATLQGYFFTTGILLVSGHTLAGTVTIPIMQTYVMLIPIIIASLLLGEQLHTRIKPQRFTSLIHGFLIMLGIILVLKSII